MLVYYNGKFMEKANVAISPDDRGFLFADGVYDVLHAYDGQILTVEKHLERMGRSLKELRIEGLATETLQPIAHRLIAENKLTNSDAIIYMQVTRGAVERNHRFPPPGTPPTVYVEAKKYSPPREMQQDGANLLTVPDQRWARCDIKTVGLLANTLAHQQAREAGAFEAMFVREGLLLEGSHSSILFVKNGVLTCPPLNNFMLPSVTRNVVLSLAAENSIETKVRPCPETELFEFEETLMLGTGVEIVPIIEVNGRKLGNGTPGPITRKLQEAFRKLTGSLRGNAQLASTPS